MVERWTRDAQGFVKWPDGEWVRHSDYATLEADKAELVKALELVKAMVVGEARQYWSTDLKTTGARMQIADICDATLAKHRKPTDTRETRR